MRGKKYALWLFLACLAAAFLGYLLGGQVEEHNPLERIPETVTDYETIMREGTVEAQGSGLKEDFTDYNEYEASVAQQIQDRKRRENNG